MTNGSQTSASKTKTQNVEIIARELGSGATVKAVLTEMKKRGLAIPDESIIRRTIRKLYGNTPREAKVRFMTTPTPHLKTIPAAASNGQPKQAAKVSVPEKSVTGVVGSNLTPYADAYLAFRAALSMVGSKEDAKRIIDLL